jgi:hypothetical protein
MICGQRHYQHHVSLQYVGISGDINQRFKDPKHAIRSIRRNLTVWVGEVVSHAVAGRRKERHPVKHSVSVEYAEWALAYFLALPLNKKKRKKPPPESIIVLNRWFGRDFASRKIHRGHSNWPDLVEYDQDTASAFRVWFGAPGRRERLSKQEIKDLSLQG